MPELLLDVQGLETTFKTSEGIVHAVNGVSFGLKEGETLGVVGESGCGKSVTMLSILGLIPTPPGNVKAGTANFFDRDLLKMSSDEIRAIRGAQIGMVFQDPMTSLNPVLTVGRQLTEPLILHLGMTKKQADDRAAGKLMGIISKAVFRIRDAHHLQQFRGSVICLLFGHSAMQHQRFCQLASHLQHRIH